MTQPPPDPQPTGAMDVHNGHDRPEPAPPPSNVIRGPRRQIVITFGIAATIVISVLAIALLYMKWYRAEEPTAVIIAWGYDDWQGAIVRVTRLDAPQDELEGKLLAKNNMVVRFHVPPGTYLVTARKGEARLGEARAILQRRAPWWPFRSVPREPVDEGAADPADRPGG